jgi:hypothetical protein
MISDVLFEAITDIEAYLANPVFDTVYERDLRVRIYSLLAHMDSIRAELDTPPQAA